MPSQPYLLCRYSWSKSWNYSLPNRMVPGPLHGIIATSSYLTVIIYVLYVLWMDEQQKWRFLLSKCHHNPIYCADIFGERVGTIVYQIGWFLFHYTASQLLLDRTQVAIGFLQVLIRVQMHVTKFWLQTRLAAILFILFEWNYQ